MPSPFPFLPVFSSGFPCFLFLDSIPCCFSGLYRSEWTIIIVFVFSFSPCPFQASFAFSLRDLLTNFSPPRPPPLLIFGRCKCAFIKGVLYFVLMLLCVLSFRHASPSIDSSPPPLCSFYPYAFRLLDSLPSSALIFPWNDDTYNSRSVFKPRLKLFLPSLAQDIHLCDPSFLYPSPIWNLPLVFALPPHLSYTAGPFFPSRDIRLVAPPFPSTPGWLRYLLLFLNVLFLSFPAVITVQPSRSLHMRRSRGWKSPLPFLPFF